MSGEAPQSAPLVAAQPGSVEQLRRFAAGGYLYAGTDNGLVRIPEGALR